MTTIHCTCGFSCTRWAEMEAHVIAMALHPDHRYTRRIIPTPRT